MQRVEVGVALGEGAVLGIERDGPLEMGDRFRVLAALRVRDSKHVQRVIVVGIFVADEAQMRDSLIVLPAIEGERRGVQTFVNCLRRRFARGRVAPADAQVETDPLVEFLFLWVLPEHRVQDVGGVVVLVPLQRFEAALVESDGLNVG